VQACFFAGFLFFFFAALATFMSLPRLRFFADIFTASDVSFFTALSVSLLRLRFFGSTVVVTSDFTSRFVTFFELMISRVRLAIKCSSILFIFRKKMRVETFAGCEVDDHEQISDR
jgi:hypothetical protein